MSIYRGSNTKEGHQLNGVDNEQQDTNKGPPATHLTLAQASDGRVTVEQ